MLSVVPELTNFLSSDYVAEDNGMPHICYHFFKETPRIDYLQ